MSKSKGYHIYIVEDDLELSTILERVLKRIDADSKLNWATSAEEAILHLKKLRKELRLKPYDLILADIYLEGAATGFDLWHLCKRTYPDVPFLATSSTPIQKLQVFFDSDLVFPPFLQKPFSVAECTTTLREILTLGRANTAISEPKKLSKKERKLSDISHGTRQ